MRVRFCMGAGRPGKLIRPTPVVPHSSEVSRVEPTSSVVLRSHTRGGRSSAAIPHVQFRQETDTRPEEETDNAAEIRGSMSAICEGSSGSTRPDIPETVSEYLTADRPGTSAALPTSLETNSNSNSTNNTETSPSHTTISHDATIRRLLRSFADLPAQANIR